MSQTAGMIKMQVRHDHMGQLRRVRILFPQSIKNGPIFQVELLFLTIRPFPTVPGFHQHPMLTISEEQAIGLQIDAVEFISLSELGPERLRHHAEHAPAIETKRTGAQ